MSSVESLASIGPGQDGVLHFRGDPRMLHSVRLKRTHVQSEIVLP